jgi:hypothetical protein
MGTIANTFVLVSPDCPVSSAVVPVARTASAPAHVIHYELLAGRPYELTFEDLIFETYVRREGLSKVEAEARAAEIRAELFRKPRACMRASALPKKYGWGVHYDGVGRLALHAMESEAYRRFAAGGVGGVKIVAALRSERG